MSGLLVAWLVSLPPVALVGWAFGRAHRKPPPQPKHRHIWAPWEEFGLREWSRTRNQIVTVYAQRRTCLDCGYLEQEHILS